MKVQLGNITNPETKETMNVVAKTKIGAEPTGFIIGLILSVAGLIMASRSAFKKGANDGMQAEEDVLDAIGLLK